MKYRLNVLGTLDLRDPNGTPLNSILQQPRRLALLIYLALTDQGGAMVKRDTLLGILWPEMPQENGRAALSQAIHFLRRSLGASAILSRGNEDISLNADVVEADATAFLDAVKACDLCTARSLYTGELLPGFFVADAHEFDEWLTNKREALRRKAAEVFWSAAEEAKEQSQPVSAAASARRAAELAANDENATRRLMEFLETMDDRAGALDAYESLARKLQADFEATPSSKTRDLAERIRRNGKVVASAESNTEAMVLPRSALRRLPWQEIRSGSRTLTGTAILMVAFLSLWGIGTRAGRSSSLPNDASVAVADAKVFDGELRDVASSIMSDVSAALVAVPRLTVQANASAVRADQPGRHFVLKPNVSRRDGQVYLVASVVDASSNTIVRSASFTADLEDSQALSNLAVDVSEFARKAMGRQLRAARLRELKSTDAEVLAESGLARMRSDSLRERGLAQYALATLDRADSLVARALERRKSAELFVERAEIAQARSWQFMLPPISDAKRALLANRDGIEFSNEAIRLNPENASGHELRGLFALNAWFSGAKDPRVAVAERNEAERSLQRAVALNPGAARAWSGLSTILTMKGDWSRAYWAAEKAFAADPYMDVSDRVTGNLFTAALETGDDDAARRSCTDISRRNRTSWAGSYCALQLIAWKAHPTPADISAAERIVAGAAENQVNAPFGPVLDLVLAVVYAKTGDAAKANALLAKPASPLADEFQPFRAWALNELGKTQLARSVLDAYMRANPSLRTGVARSVRFAALN